MYQIILIGVREDVARSEVVKKLAVLFKAKHEQIEKLFESSGYVIKKGIIEEVAQTYKAAIEATGATCRMEQEVVIEPLSVDLPTDEPKIELVETHQPVVEAVQEVTGRVESGFMEYMSMSNLLMIVAFGFMAWGIVPIIFPDINKPSESLLEKITIIGKSTHEDFEKFRDEGGLNTSPVWHGLHVTNVLTQYKEGRLSMIQLEINGKAKWLSSIKEWTTDAKPTPKETRSLLSSICGIAQNAWSVNEMGGSAETNRNGQKFMCFYTMEDSHIKISIGSD